MGFLLQVSYRVAFVLATALARCTPWVGGSVFPYDFVACRLPMPTSGGSVGEVRSLE